MLRRSVYVFGYGYIKFRKELAKFRELRKAFRITLIADTETTLVVEVIGRRPLVIEEDTYFPRIDSVRELLRKASELV